MSENVNLPTRPKMHGNALDGPWERVTSERPGRVHFYDVPTGDYVASADRKYAAAVQALPDLLAACEAVVSHYQTMSGNPNAPVPDKYWIHGALLARAALARARGEVPHAE